MIRKGIQQFFQAFPAAERLVAGQEKAAVQICHLRQAPPHRFALGPARVEQAGQAALLAEGGRFGGAGHRQQPGQPLPGQGGQGMGQQRFAAQRGQQLVAAEPLAFSRRQHHAAHPGRAIGRLCLPEAGKIGLIHLLCQTVTGGSAGFVPFHPFLCLGGQTASAAALAPDAAPGQGEAQFLFRPAHQGQRLGVGHPHFGSGGPQAAQALHALQQLPGPFPEKPLACLVADPQFQCYLHGSSSLLIGRPARTKRAGQNRLQILNVHLVQLLFAVAALAAEQQDQQQDQGRHIAQQEG